ncbi:hypothetical protein RHD99_14740 [Buttiauxella selenatireducens]|uniref:Uncharacterized protein n=1 Tax=Buttiauxella selenatireducens TaxID=3073902 RepID=A0ABY9S5W2_9ENTR|nr:hypothetical protein [Buttiauxella sp. R73]WMY72729.1 hypothetical protein RHD99_14740 [Buttiauxella sp. R73]
MSRPKFDEVFIEMARLQGHKLNGQDKLIVRTRFASAQAAKERHRQRMSAEPYQWARKAPPR